MLTPEEWLLENRDIVDWNYLKDQLKDLIYIGDVFRYMQQYHDYVVEYERILNLD